MQRIIRKNLTLATHQKTSARTFGVLAAILTILSVASIASASEEESATELAKKTQNPKKRQHKKGAQKKRKRRREKEGNVGCVGEWVKASEGGAPLISKF